MAVDRVVCGNASFTAHQLAINLRTRMAALAEKMDALPAVFPDPARVTGRVQAKVRALILALLDDQAFHEQLARTCASRLLMPDPAAGRALDPATTAGRVSVAGAAPVKGGGTNWRLQPLLLDEQRRSLAAAAEWLPVVSAGNFEAYRLMPEIPRPSYSNLTQTVFTSSNLIDFQLDRLSQQHFRGLAEGRIAAVLFAAWASGNEKGVSPGECGGAGAGIFADGAGGSVCGGWADAAI